MTEHKVATREEWQAAREQLATLEAEYSELRRKVAEKRRELPWVPVEKEYEFDTEAGKKTPAELFDGRAQLLACPDRSADRLQGADGVDVPVGLDVRDRLPIRLRARDDPRPGRADPRGQADDRGP